MGPSVYGRLVHTKDSDQGEDQLGRLGVTCLRLQMVCWLPIRILRLLSVADRTLAEKVGTALCGLYGGIRQV